MAENESNNNEMYIRLGKMHIAQAMYEGPPNPSKLQNNMGLVTSATGLNNEQIIEAWFFLVQEAGSKMFNNKKKETVGFKSNS